MEDFDKFEFEMLKAQLDAAQRDNAVLAQRLAAIETRLATVQMTVDDLQTKSTDATDESQVVSTPASELVEPFNDVTQMVDPDKAATEQQLFKDASIKERRSTEWSPDSVGGGPLGLHKFIELAEHKLELKGEQNAGSGSSSGAGINVTLEVNSDGDELAKGASQEKWALPIRRRTANGDGFILEWARPGGSFSFTLPPGSSVGPCAPTYSMRVYGCKLQLVRQNRKLIDGGTPGEESSCQNDGDPVVVAEINMSDFQSCFGGMVPPPPGGELSISPVELTVCVPNSSSGINYRKITVLAAGGITNWLSFTSCS